jgi:uncharacterized ferredoxin-like protein
MTKLSENQIRSEALLDIAKKMIIAARTAPKARGFDNLEMAIITGKELNLLTVKMREIGQTHDNNIFLRDAQNVMASAELVVLMGSRIKSTGLQICGMCGFENCQEKDKHPEVPCTFNTVDLGIAMGSAVSLAMDHRVDNRIMYTIGMAALQLELLGKDVKIIFGIPLSAGSKNPFFDRK